MSKTRAHHKATVSSQTHLVPRGEESARLGVEESFPPQPPRSAAPHQYKWLIRAFTVARLTGGRRARSSRYLDTFSSSSSISGWGEMDQVRNPPSNHLPCPAALPLILGDSTPYPPLSQIRPVGELQGTPALHREWE